MNEVVEAEIIYTLKMDNLKLRTENELLKAVLQQVKEECLTYTKLKEE